MKSIITLTTLSPPNPPTPKLPVSLRSHHSPKFSPPTNNSRPPIGRLFIAHHPPPPPPSHHNNDDDDNNNNNGNNNNSNNSNNGNNEYNGGDDDKGFEWPRLLLWFIQRWFVTLPEYGWAVGFSGVATTATANFYLAMAEMCLEVSLTLMLFAVGFTLAAACVIASLVAFFFIF